MISARMSRLAKVLTTVCALTAVAVLAAACGERINVPGGNAMAQRGAMLFNQRCSGCHTLSYAATNGSAAKVTTKQFNNGPNFNVRCERPLTRVLYAIENGGFSGAIMPQNIVVGQDAQAVAQFVATYAGRQAPRVPGVVPCQQEPVGSLPALTAAGTSTASATANQASQQTAKAAPKSQSPAGSSTGGTGGKGKAKPGAGRSGAAGRGSQSGGSGSGGQGAGGGRPSSAP
jgi:mono/diheme cytochrome c family protein